MYSTLIVQRRERVNLLVKTLLSSSNQERRVASNRHLLHKLQSTILCFRVFIFLSQPPLLLLLPLTKLTLLVYLNLASFHLAASCEPQGKSLDQSLQQTIPQWVHNRRLLLAIHTFQATVFARIHLACLT